MDALAIGRRLTKLRAGKERASVAAELGISRSALAMYELGRRIPRDEIKKRLANYYGKSVDEIFYD